MSRAENANILIDISYELDLFVILLYNENRNPIHEMLVFKREHIKPQLSTCDFKENLRK